MLIAIPLNDFPLLAIKMALSNRLPRRGHQIENFRIALDGK